jgi:small subunit ribosomal protein S2
MLKLPTVEELFVAGAHFGHQKYKSHPKTKNHLFDVVNGVYIIDLEKSRAMLESAANYVKKQAASGKVILLVGTKRQARDQIEKIGRELGIAYITNKWLGGTLTNFSTIKSSLKKLEDLVSQTQSEDWSKKSKKTQAMIQTQIDRLHRNLDGIKSLEKLPDLLIIVDIAEEKTAVMEAKKLSIPVIGLVDTNADYTLVDYPIAVNDDSFKTVELVLNTLAQAISEGKKTAPKTETITETEEVESQPQALANNSTKAARIKGVK